MKKYGVFIIFLLLNIICINNVHASKECTYRYKSKEYGMTSVRLIITGTDAYGYIDTLNGESEYNSRKQDDYGWDTNKYKNKNEVCPYYILAESSGFNTSLRSGYDYNQLASYIGGIGVLDKKEAHVAISTTIEEDKKKNGDAWDASHDVWNNQDDSDIVVDDKKKTTKYTCRYSNSKDEVEKNNLTSGGLKIYTDNTYYAYVTKWKGGDEGFFDNNEFPSATFYNGANLQKCPYYMIVDYNGKNSVSFTNTRESTSGDRVVLISETIKDDKPDYDEERDGRTETDEETEERTKKENEKHKEEVNEWTDMERPYDKYVGDNVCGEERVTKALRALGIFILIAKFAIPIIIIVKGTLDLVNTVTKGTSDSLKKEFTSLGFRVVIGLFIMFAPTILKASISGLSYYKVISKEAEACQKCLFDPFGEGNCDSANVPELAEKEVEYQELCYENESGRQICERIKDSELDVKSICYKGSDDKYVCDTITSVSASEICYTAENGQKKCAPKVDATGQEIKTRTVDVDYKEVCQKNSNGKWVCQRIKNVDYQEVCYKNDEGVLVCFREQDASGQDIGDRVDDASGQNVGDRVDDASGQDVGDRVDDASGQDIGDRVDDATGQDIGDRVIDADAVTPGGSKTVYIDEPDYTKRIR